MFLHVYIQFTLLNKLAFWFDSKMYLSSLLRREEKEWHDLLNEQIFTETKEDTENRGPPVCIEHLRQVYKRAQLPLTKRKQVGCFSGISNWHWWKCLQQNGKRLDYIPFVNTSQHLSWNPSHDDLDMSTKYYPTSVRNQMMFFLRGKNCSANLVKLVQSALCEDGYTEEQDSFSDHNYTMNEGNEPYLSQPRCKRRRKHRPRLHPLTLEQHLNSHLIDPQQVLDSAAKFSTIYQDYINYVTSNGVNAQEPEEQEDCRRSKIWWRHHSSTKDVFILLDTDEFSGVALPTSYVHVEVEDNEEGQKSVICSCKTYTFHQASIFARF